MVADRIPLTQVNTYVTPSPVEFVEEMETPTPTPIQAHDLTTWFNYESVKLKVVDGVIENLIISDVSIDSELKPKFLSKSRDIEIISWAITKKIFDGESIETYESSSEYVYGSALDVKLSDGTSLSSFEDYEYLYDRVGDLIYLDSIPIMILSCLHLMIHLKVGMVGMDLNLIVFGYYDLDYAENKVILEDKIAISVDSISTATLYR